MHTVILRTCPECGVQFEPARKWQTFCCKAHKANFANVQTVRGRVAMVLFSTSARGRRSASDLVTYVRRELYALDAQWALEDRTAGRNPALVAEIKRVAGWRATDLWEAK